MSMNAALTVSQLFSYPIKSAAGNAQSQLSLGPKGPLGDRRWMVVNQHGKHMTQRQYARMCLLDVVVDGDGLILDTPTMPTCRVAAAGGEQTLAQVWSDTVVAIDAGDEVAAWLTDFIGKTARLVYMPDSTERIVAKTPRQSDSEYPQPTVGFADAYPLLVASDSSLADFNRHLSQSITMDRFRPNIVISGAEAWAEDSWRTLRIGDVTITLVSPCSRCVMPSIEQRTGNKQQEVLDALNQHRRWDRQTWFGQNAIHDRAGTLCVGDVVEIIE